MRYGLMTRVLLRISCSLTVNTGPCRFRSAPVETPVTRKRNNDGNTFEPSSQTSTPSASVAPSSTASAERSSTSIASSTVPAPRFDSRTEPPSPATTKNETSSARPLSQPREDQRTAYSDEQYIYILREVAAAEVHIDGFGKTRKRFEKSTRLIPENPLSTTKIYWKQVQDRYRRLQDQYNSHDNENQRLSVPEEGKWADWRISEIEESS